MRMAVLAGSISHSRSRVTHTVARMEKDGLVTRSACVSDGRGVEAALTEKGFGVLQSAAPTHVEGVRRFLVDLAGDEDFAAVGRVFNAVADKLVEANPDADIR
jgi:DNA-binding MarR family transcriptional regulator